MGVCDAESYPEQCLNECGGTLCDCESEYTQECYDECGIPPFCDCNAEELSDEC